VDELELHYGQRLVGRGGLQLGDLGVKTMDDALRWTPYAAEIVGGDVVVTTERRDV
jgi:riboflavin biosynthesis pyrimidine reductase